MCIRDRHLLVHDAGNDGLCGAVLAQQAGGVAGLGHRDDGGSVDVLGGQAGSVRGCVADADLAVAGIHQTVVAVDVYKRQDKDEAGSTVYYSYKVEEINTSADYQVSYSTTNGVTSGLITMVNTKTPEQEEPTYEDVYKRQGPGRSPRDRRGKRRNFQNHLYNRSLNFHFGG